MDTLTLFSPAKVNLFLRVTAKRPDGFHELSSLFQTLSLGDTLEMSLAQQEALTCDEATLPLDERNLVIKALRLFRLKSHIPSNFKVHLNKKIPMQAGLGGGSSNAATVLWGCNQLTGGCFSDEVLQQWSSEIGSDIPFFFSQGTAYCQGRGEIVSALEKTAACLPLFASLPLWVAQPKSGLETKEVFRKLHFSKNLGAEIAQLDFERCLSHSWERFNDLETPAFELNPSLARLKSSLLEAGFDFVLMSGSGSSFLCYGSPSSASLFADFSDVRFFPVHFISRSSSNWYKENNFLKRM